MFKRRLGLDPHGPDGGDMTGAASGCPDIWELEDGSVAVIGVRKTAILKSFLPHSAGCGLDEEIVVIPKQLLINALKDLGK